MTACPRCKQYNSMTLESTGRFLCHNPTDQSLAGVGIKTTARPEYRLRCTCDWSITGIIKGDYFIPNPDQVIPDETK